MSLARKPLESREAYNKRMRYTHIFNIVFGIVLMIVLIMIFKPWELLKDEPTRDPGLCRQGLGGDGCPEVDTRTDNAQEPYENLPY